MKIKVITGLAILSLFAVSCKSGNTDDAATTDTTAVEMTADTIATEQPIPEEDSTVVVEENTSMESKNTENDAKSSNSDQTNKEVKESINKAAKTTQTIGRKSTNAKNESYKENVKKSISESTKKSQTTVTRGGGE